MFDRVIVVDWSARSSPARGRDSIWIAIAEQGSQRIVTRNLATRSLACADLEALCRQPGTTLVGVDFSLGYPAGCAAALGLGGVAWRSMWTLLADLVDDADDNSNNRFEVAAELNARIGHAPGPFWGCPPTHRSRSLSSTKVPCAPLAEWRLVERVLQQRGHRPFSSWQLLGAGSVGGQSLLGIARLARLEAALVAAGRAVRVWPFEADASAPTTDASDAGRVVIAEVWPSLFPVPKHRGVARDEIQVVETVRRLARGAAFDAVDRLPTASKAAVRAEEGWILGA